MTYLALLRRPGYLPGVDRMQAMDCCFFLNSTELKRCFDFLTQLVSDWNLSGFFLYFIIDIICAKILLNLSLLQKT